MIRQLTVLVGLGLILSAEALAFDAKDYAAARRAVTEVEAAMRQVATDHGKAEAGYREAAAKRRSCNSLAWANAYAPVMQELETQRQALESARRLAGGYRAALEQARREIDAEDREIREHPEGVADRYWAALEANTKQMREGYIEKMNGAVLPAYRLYAEAMGLSAKVLDQVASDCTQPPGDAAARRTAVDKATPLLKDITTRAEGMKKAIPAR
ncbi:MAG: hypothetical protein FJX65_16325 [Alphaproteobacteria bacterium]|nr:hypothetical protein [Alphaproteobacteria bacterium]